MPTLNLLPQRLANQHLSQPTFDTPEAVVASLGAVQSQDYGAGKWAVGLRTNGLDDTAVEQALTDGRILRTHVLRPTWHFVTPADIRWMLELTAPRVNALAAHYYRKLELDAPLFKKSNAIIAHALSGGNHLTRTELGVILERAGINTQDLLRLAYVVGAAELDGIICSGTRKGKQFTYALLDERAPKAKRLSRDESLGELTRRYFNAHGPAKLSDYVWWSGLTSADAKKGIELCKGLVSREMIDGQMHWYGENVPLKKTKFTAYLLPNYDEYIVGYTDRTAILNAVEQTKLDARGNVLFNHTIVLDGKVAGTWKRTEKKSSVLVELTPFQPLTEAQAKAIAKAAKRYGEFWGFPVELNGLKA